MIYGFKIANMRKKKTSSKIKVRLRANKLERKRRRSNRKKRDLNILRSVRVKYPSEEKNSNQRYYKPPSKVVVSALPSFSLLENTNNVLLFIKSIDKIKKQRKFKIIEFDISQVNIIDIGAVGLMLSKINELSKLNIKVIGNLPEDSVCNELIYNSGFLNHMRDLKGRSFKLRQENSNLMVNRGFDKTSNALIGSVVRKSVGHLTGIESSYRPLYSIIQEMCANSVEHANIQNKNWLFSVWYKNEDEVCFTMTDIGSGVLKTINRKFSQIIKESMLIDNVQILNRAFDKKYQSITGDINRNKGLPKIKNAAVNNYIKNLKVITNDVILDFSSETNSKEIKQNFNGTFYYWELDKKCIEKWKSRN